MKEKICSLALAAAVIAFTGVAGWAQQSSSSTRSTRSTESTSSTKSTSDTSGASASSSEKHFIAEAAQADMAEVELGKLAEKNASDRSVKDFAKKMVDDHSKNQKKVDDTASKLGVSVPASLSAKDQAERDKLSKLSGPEFDKAYMTDMVRDHKKDVATFKRESTSAKNDVVQTYASETLPTLEDHLKQAEDVNAKVNGSASSAAMR